MEHVRHGVMDALAVTRAMGRVCSALGYQDCSEDPISFSAENDLQSRFEPSVSRDRFSSHVCFCDIRTVLMGCVAGEWIVNTEVPK